jgi:hypothetical protein
LAFALGFQEAINGTTANDAPTAPTAEVIPISTFLRVVIFSSIKTYIGMNGNI